jgi:hypothetical protein
MEDNTKNYLNHYKYYHRLSTEFNVTCQIDGCNSHFTRFLSYQSHYYKIHHVRSAPQVAILPQESLQPAVAQMDYDGAGENLLFESPSNTPGRKLSVIYINFKVLMLSDQITDREQSVTVPNQMNETEWLSGLSLHLRAQHYLTFNALGIILNAFEEHAERKVNLIKVNTNRYYVLWN